MKYIIFYDINDNEGRGYALAATNKADYIMSVMERLGVNVEIVSASLTSSKGYVKASETKLTEHITLVKLTAFKWGNKLQKLIARMWNFWGMFLYLLKNTKKDEEIIVYHSLANMSSVKWAKKIKKFKLILEVEEIYNDVIKKSESSRRKEIEFIKSADKYIFPTELLNEKFNVEGKPYTIIHGTYKVEEDRNVSFDDGKIHILYAGTFDPVKGGAQATIAATEYLTEDYRVHILGFGTDKDKSKALDKIKYINRISKSKVSYDGLFSGEEYIRFLQKCQIGMSTQNPDADFNDTSFPSKILSYMANGLRVVTVRIPVVETSDVGSCLYYYEDQEPKEIAKAIMGINFNDNYDSRKKISELDREFSDSLKELLS